MADLGRVPSRSALDDAAAPAVEPADVPRLALEQTLFALAERSKVDGPTLGDWQAHAVRHREVLLARARDKGWHTGSLTRALAAIDADARQRAPGGRQTRAVVLSGAFVADFDGRAGWVITAQWEMTMMLERDPLGAAKIALGHIRAWAITNDGVILGEAMCD